MNTTIATGTGSWKKAGNDVHRNEKTFSLLLERLRRNDPKCSNVVFLNDPLSNNDDAAESLGLSLTHTHHVTEISITIHQLTAAGRYESLLAWIASSSSLLVVELNGYGDYTFPRANPAVTVRFLRALQDSKVVQTVSLFGCFYVDSTVFVQFLDGAKSMRALEMDCAVFVQSTGNPDNHYHNIAEAFQRSVTLEKLHFEITEATNTNIVDIVDALRGNTGLRQLILENGRRIQNGNSERIARAIAGIICHSKSLVHLELQDFQFSMRNGSSIIRGLLDKSDTSVLNSLSLRSCQFDNETARMLQQVLLQSRQITTLALSRTQLGNEDSLSLNIIAETLRSHSSAITSLELEPWRPFEGSQTMNCCLESIVNSSLTQIVLNCSFDPFLSIFLSGSIPRMQHLTCLRVRISHPEKVNNGMREIVFDGLRRNSSLTQIDIRIRDDLWPPQDQRYMDKIALRNRGIRAWLKTTHVTNIDECIQTYPIFLSQIGVCEHGPSWCYHTLMSLGDTVGVSDWQET